MDSGLPELPGYLFQANLAGVISLVLTVLLPVLVGLATKSQASPAIKACLLLVLAGVKSVVEAWLAGNLGWAVMWTIVVNVVIAIAIHFGLWKPPNAGGNSVASWAATNGRT